MKILLVSRDTDYAKRLGKTLGKGHQLTVINHLGFIIDENKVPEIQDLVLIDITSYKPEVFWPRVIDNLRRISVTNVVIVDSRGHWRRAWTAANHGAVGYFSKASKPAKVRQHLETWVNTT